MAASLRFTLLKQASPTPSFRVPPGAVSQKDDAGYHATMGVNADLMTGAKKATRAMVGWLCGHGNGYPARTRRGDAPCGNDGCGTLRYEHDLAGGTAGRDLLVGGLRLGQRVYVSDVNVEFVSGG
jgi:hypothetical protein